MASPPQVACDNRSLDLESSWKWCQQLCRSSRSSFYYSFALLDPPRRQAMSALYAFARITDDLGDAERRPELRHADLAAWQQQLYQWLPQSRSLGTLTTAGVFDMSPNWAAAPWITDQRSNCGTLENNGIKICGLSTDCCALPSRNSDLLADNGNSRSLSQYDLLWPALVESVHRFGIPPQLLEKIILGVAMDLKVVRLQDWEDLRNYCLHVASAVGLACTYIWRSGDEIPVQPAIDCGLAFQLTNILRDVGEDARAGRVYLPASRLEAHGICSSDWLRGCPGGRWSLLIEEVAAEAQRLYASGWDTIHGLTPRSQRMFSLIWHSYRGLLERVVRHKDKLWSEQRIRLPPHQRLWLFTTHLLPTFRPQFPE